MSAHEYYTTGRVMRRKSFWSWLTGGPSEEEQRQAAAEAAEAARQAQWVRLQDALHNSEHYQKLQADLADLQAQLDSSDDEDAARALRTQIKWAQRAIDAYSSAFIANMVQGGRSAG